MASNPSIWERLKSLFGRESTSSPPSLPAEPQDEAEQKEGGGGVVRPKKPRPKKVEPKADKQKKPEPEKPEPKKPEPKKPGQKKAGAKKAESEKPEPKIRGRAPQPPKGKTARTIQVNRPEKARASSQDPLFPVIGKPIIVPPPPVPASPRGPTIDLVLGIDLGTSCTKVVIGDNWQNRAYAVPFGSKISEIASWLHPTRLGEETNLKMRLMDDPDSPHLRAVVACYLAEVIAYAQNWFRENSSPNYRQGNWIWSLNLGFPEKNVTSDSRLAAAYRTCAAIALQLVAGSSAPTPKLAEKIAKSGKKTPSLNPAPQVELYPEIAAQLAGYINSPFRKPGKLLLIDVGAGTLDISTLIIHETNAANVVSFHVCDVQPLGVLRLYSARAEALHRICDGCVKQSVADFQNGLTPIPESVDHMLGEKFLPPIPLAKHEFEMASSKFSDQMLDTVLSCLTRFGALQREAHDNTDFRPWGDSLRLFLTGGGSRSEFYRQQIADGPLEGEFRRFTHWNPDPIQRERNGEGLQRETMPLPRNLVGFPSSLSEHFDRLSVAYGLAQGAVNLPQTTGN